LEMKNHSAVEQGFTLIELMVTLAMVAILMAIAVSSFTTLQRKAELTSFSNSLLSGINAARGEAMKRGRNAMVVPADGLSWNSGWTVFVDVNRDGAYNEATDITVLKREAAPSYLTVTNTAVTAADGLYIMYDASGYSRLTGGGFGAWTVQVARNDVTGSTLLAQTRRIKIAATGRARVCTPATATDTNCLNTTAL
jgi:type IV fimbrial biogenesis protein FimT